MPKAHQPKIARLVFCHVDILLHIASIIGDLPKHIDARFIRSPMQWTPQRTNASRNRSKQVGIRRTNHSNGGSATVLFMIRMNDQKQIERFDEIGSA